MERDFWFCMGLYVYVALEFLYMRDRQTELDRVRCMLDMSFWTKSYDLIQKTCVC